MKNGNTHEIQKNTPKHVKSQIFRNWIQKWIISSTQLSIVVTFYGKILMWYTCSIWLNRNHLQKIRCLMFYMKTISKFIELKFWKLILQPKQLLLYFILSLGWYQLLTNTMYVPWIFSLENNSSKKHSRQNYLVYTCT